MMEAIEVTVKFDQRGGLRPLSFTWKGHRYPVTSSGRRWEQDGNLHILVMVPIERLFELIFDRTEDRWYLKQIDRRRVVSA